MISSLHVYPVKSCRGISTGQALMRNTGAFACCPHPVPCTRGVHQRYTTPHDYLVPYMWGGTGAIPFSSQCHNVDAAAAGSRITCPACPSQCSAVLAPACTCCDHAGLACDRKWVIVKEGDGKFITQRQVPKLCMVRLLPWDGGPTRRA